MRAGRHRLRLPPTVAVTSTRLLAKVQTCDCEAIKKESEFLEPSRRLAGKTVKQGANRCALYRKHM